MPGSVKAAAAARGRAGLQPPAEAAGAWRRQHATPLETQSLAQLRQTWTLHFSDEPPRLTTPYLLALAIAWRLQTHAQGGLAGPAKRRIAELQRRFADDPGHSPAPPPHLPPGSALVQAYRGVRHEVRVLEGGFGYEGETFASLSAVAFRITGTKQSGFVFFGLKARRR